MAGEKTGVLWPDELKAYMLDRKEEDFLLVDVRQPQEYETEHLPGAQLIPLRELMDRMAELPGDKELVFYCSHGGRSRAAAEVCSESGRFSLPIFSLAGGITAWEEAVVEALPRLEVFEPAESSEDWARTAMNLERGAFLFYMFLIGKCADEPYVKSLEDLAAMETGHARLIYHLFPGDERTTENFQDVYGSLAGDIVEGGMPLDAVCRKLETASGHFMTNALEMAIRIEFAAYDLYRTLANRTRDEGIRKALFTLSQAEKQHLFRVADMFQDIFPQP
jgi:sulfur-carrier protein adenylyltransferase/sulfurtransferase